MKVLGVFLPFAGIVLWKVSILLQAVKYSSALYEVVNSSIHGVSVFCVLVKPEAVFVFAPVYRHPANAYSAANSFFCSCNSLLLMATTTIGPRINLEIKLYDA